jgi:hypothetical protein
MSLIVLSSAQDKYSSRGTLKVNDLSSLTQINTSGLQDPASFTNNINPVFKIKPNSEVCLKSANYNRKAVVKIGNNESFALYVGEELRAKWDSSATRSLSETTSFPIPIPLQPGTYNMRALAIMINRMLDWYISYPDLFGNVWVETAASQDDRTNDFGLVWNFANNGNVLTDVKTTMTTAIPWLDQRDSFTYVGATGVYQTPILAVAGFESNSGILTNLPLSLKSGEMKWTTTGADTGWRIGLTRPTIDDGAAEGRSRLRPPNFTGTWFFDYAVEYESNTFRLYHSVMEGGVMVMKEVEYYNNTAADFTPSLAADTEGRNLTSMYRGSPLTGAILTTNPKTVSIKFYGEDTVVAITNTADAVFILTDSRLCLSPTASFPGNAEEIAYTPTRNRFFKPVGLTTAALYPKVELIGSTGATKQVTLSVYNGITAGTTTSPNTNYTYPNKYADVDEVNTFSAGSSFWSRATATNDFNTGRIAELVDTSISYQSDSAALQKQYIGLSGPETGSGVVPVRWEEGNPQIPYTAVDVGTPCPVAWGLGLILVGSQNGLADYTTAGVYCSETTDVAAMFGFPDKDSVWRSRDGSAYIYTDAPAEPDVAVPTNTPGAFYGWYFGSDTAPLFTRGTLFVRVPQLTHQSYNFGKGIPSKVIGQLPLHTHAGGVDNDGETYWEPTNLTYLDLNNPAEMNLNDLTIEIVDKTETLVEDLTASTTIVLHIREK